jgi:uncharacterized membrane protein
MQHIFLSILITDEPVIFGILMAVLALLFYTSQSENPILRKFYGIVPVLLLAYFIPGILVSIGLIDGHAEGINFISKRMLLPASLILLTLSVDMKAIMSLGPKALIMFFTATIGIVIGGPLALWIVSLFNPDVLADHGDASIWKGMATVAGSWIGGSANQTAMKEIYKAGDGLFSAMVIVDVVVANIWMAILLYGAGVSDKLDRFLKADNSSIESLKKKVTDFQAANNRIPSFTDLIVMLGVVFAFVGLSHWLSTAIATPLDTWIKDALAADPTSNIKFITSFGSDFFWLIVFATAFGLAMSFTKARKFEGVGASKMGSVFIYILVATIGLHMNFAEMWADWERNSLLIIIGFVWMLVHVIILLTVAKLIKAPFFFVAVGSQANIGGAASAPVVASAFSPALAPVGVLLAVLGYALGTFAAILCAMMMQGISA